MSVNIGRAPFNRQRGVILLSLFVLLFLAGAGVVISVLDNNAIAQRRSSNTVFALGEAKAALIAYAVLYSDYYAGSGPGYLPCPDSNGNGAENVGCGLNSLGRLPELITLPSGSDFQLSTYNNDIDEQFWYGVSDIFRRGALGVLNTATVSTLTLDARNQLAAVLIAPGPATGAQARPSNASDRYLEDSNTAAPDFVSGDAANPELFNDRVLAISIDEIMMPITRKVADVLQEQLDAYHVLLTRYPTDLEFGPWLLLAPLPAWFTTNGWNAVTNYVQDTPDQATITFTGCPNISYQLSYVAIDTPASILKIGAQC
ncbi:MAG: hypothetical protein DHS20C12_03350 [Pseudohongiella sp.]|nr:MAG: hypothetical protein DHS20C12_03350 [Pseudohongiella sp.]